MDNYQYDVNNQNNQYDQNNQYNQYPMKRDNLATASLVFGIISIFGVFTVWLGVIFSIAAIVLSVLSRLNAGKFEKGAVPGMAMGCICLVISLMLFVFIINLLDNPEFMDLINDYMNDYLR